MTLIPEMWAAINITAMMLGSITILFVLINLFGAFLDDLIDDILKAAQ